MNVGFSEEQLLAGYAAWLRWLEQKRKELAGKQARMERRMARSQPAEDTPGLAEIQENMAETILEESPPTEADPPSIPDRPEETLPEKAGDATPGETGGATPAGDEDEDEDDWL